MKTVYQISILVFCCFCTNVLRAQNVSDCIKRSEAFYQQLDSFSLTVEFLMYEDHTSKKIISSMEGLVWKNPTAYRVKYPELEIMDNGTVYINCFEGSQKMIVASSKKMEALNVAGMNLDSILTFATQVNVVTENNQVAIQAFFNHSGNSQSYSRVDIKYNLPDYDLNSTVFYFTQPAYEDLYEENGSAQRLEIRYSRLNKKPFFTASGFSASSYYKLTNNVASGVGAFKNYTIQLIQ